MNLSMSLNRLVAFLGQQLLPTNTLLHIKTNIDGQQSAALSTTTGGTRAKEKKLSKSLIFEHAVGCIFHLHMASLCNQKYLK